MSSINTIFSSTRPIHKTNCICVSDPARSKQSTKPEHRKSHHRTNSSAFNPSYFLHSASSRMFSNMWEKRLSLIELKRKFPRFIDKWTSLSQPSSTIDVSTSFTFRRRLYNSDDEDHKEDKSVLGGWQRDGNLIRMITYFTPFFMAVT